MMSATNAQKGGGASNSIIAAYVIFFGAGLLIFHFVADQEFSSILTLAAMLQCLSLLLLAMKLTGESAAGVSAKTLMLEGVSLCLRLSSTLWRTGYQPSDASGDFFYQIADLGSLGLVGYLLMMVLVAKRGTYQQAEDSFAHSDKLVAGVFVLACCLYCDMNRSPIFDVLWLFGLYVDAIAMVPQLLLIRNNGGKVAPMLSHYIAMTVASRLLSTVFWWIAAEDVVYSAWFSGLEHGGWSILLGYGVHLLLLSDFFFYYVKTCLTKGIPGLGEAAFCDDV